MIWAIVKFQFEGIHKYPESNTYLKFPHHHIFHVEVKLEQKHNNRDIEYHYLKSILIQTNWIKNETESCEQIAENIINFLTINYPDRKKTVTVLEDGTNGAMVE